MGIFSTQDRNKLRSFLQGVDAPETAEGLLSDCRKTEVNSRHAFELLAQSLNDELKVQNESLSRTKKQMSATAEVKGQAEGDLANTNKDLDEDRAYIKDLSQHCQQRAIDHEVSIKSRQEELNALKEGRRVIAEATA